MQPPLGRCCGAGSATATVLDVFEMNSPYISLRDRVRWLGHRLSASPWMTDTLPAAGARLRAYAQLTRLNRPIGIWLLLWPVLWALWLSSAGHPDPKAFVIFVVGVVLTRSAGCA